MNIRPYVIINGKSSESIRGLIVSELAPIRKPQMRVLTETVDGKAGDINTPLGYEAYDKPVKIGLAGNYDIDEIIDYFNSEGIVIFSNEPDKYYRFSIYSDIDFDKLLRFKTATVNFHIQPFKYPVNEKELTFEITSDPETIAVFNAGNYHSLPVISITASDDISVSLNGSEILLIEFGDDEKTITINAEELNAYFEDKTLANRLITGDYDNIKLVRGWNNLTFTGAVSEVKISNYTRFL